ncbi:hypothetical protein [Taklimakanibacter lacteus]
MTRPDWYFDDLKQVGTDFADAALDAYPHRRSIHFAGKRAE